MRTGLSQHTSMRQELRVNPRLYQAMDMLYMPMMDLQQHLKQELLVNPFLELLEPEEEEAPEQKDAEQEKEQKEKEEEMDWEEILLNGFEVGGTREQYEQLEYTEPVTVETKDLIDYLREQLQMLTLTPRQLLLAEEFLGNINDEGYLAASLEEILGSVNHLVEGHVEGESEAEDEPEGEGDTGAAGADAANPPAAFYTSLEAEEMLAIIQRLDPPGIGARDLRECLLIQLGEQAEAVRRGARGGAGRGRRAGPARSQARAQARQPERRLYHPRSDRGKDRHPLPGVPQRHRDASSAPQPLLPGDRARQEEDDSREPRVHRVEDE
jgi:RNA polymerase sigma-54 factor